MLGPVSICKGDRRYTILAFNPATQAHSAMAINREETGKICITLGHDQDCWHTDVVKVLASRSRLSDNVGHMLSIVHNYPTPVIILCNSLMKGRGIMCNCGI